MRKCTETHSLREERCTHCARIFFVCSHCDCGQTYCSKDCRKAGQSKLRREANRRHQQSPEGRADHADRQRNYRAKKKVTDVGGKGLEESGNVCPPITPPPAMNAVAEPMGEGESYASTSCRDPAIQRENPVNDAILILIISLQATSIETQQADSSQKEPLPTAAPKDARLDVKI